MLKHLSLFTWVAYEHPTNKPVPGTRGSSVDDPGIADNHLRWGPRSNDRKSHTGSRISVWYNTRKSMRCPYMIGPSGFADSVAASIPTSPGPKRYQNPFRHGSRAAEYVGVVSYPQPHPPGPLSASGASVGDAGGLSWPGWKQRGAGPRQWGWCRLPIPTHTPQHAAPACALRGARTQPLVSWHPHRTCEGLGGCAAAPSVPSIP
jgi:hypothetical protein